MLYPPIAYTEESMKTYTVTTLGCKVNQYEGQQMRQLLADLGLSAVALDAGPDLVIVNTCCVTHTASAKSRQLIRKSRNHNPDSIILIAGCLPAGPSEFHLDFGPRVVAVSDKDRLVETIVSLVGKHSCESSQSSANSPKSQNLQCIETADERKQKTSNAENEFSQLPLLKTFTEHSRAFLKVQDGCDGLCSYCIIPKIRPRVCNKNVKSAVEEAKALVSSGHCEIVLTGIFLGAFGHATVRRKFWNEKDLGAFVDLVDRMAQVEGLKRLRLSSLEPGDVTEELLELFKKHRNLMPHLHLPLQSGSERILKRMCRQYTLSQYVATIGKIRTYIDRPAITTDVIVGFPGETEEDFVQTLAFAEDMAFSKIHVFRFSSREGTAASKMQPVVKPEVISGRTQRLLNLDRRLQRQFRRQFVGEQVSVLVEAGNPPAGRTERYFQVNISDLKGVGQAGTGEIVEGMLRK